MPLESLRTDILLPCSALAGLTGLVWAKAAYDRVAEIRARRIHPQKLARPRDVAAHLENTRAMDNFANLFQLPMLFYVLCLALAVSGAATPGFVTAAWGFVGLRALHSAVQVTYNRVVHRFAVWAVGAVWVFGMWGAFVVQRLG